MKIALLIVCSLLSSLGFASPLSANEKLITFVEENRTGNSTDYFFEMQMFNGMWDEVILVFGYVDNAPVCEALIKVGKEDSPNRAFRCRRAN